MKTIKYFTLLAALCLLTLQAAAQPRISIFFDHVSEIARQEHISVREAAQRVRQLGIEGIDVRVTMSDAELQMLDSLGFQNASAIADINFVRGEQPQAVRQALDFMKRHGYKRLLIIPGLLPENPAPQLMDDVCNRIASFVNQVAKEGIDVMVEDYDNPRSPCYNTATLDRLFAAAPALNHVFDTGNYLFCDEDVMTALRHYLGRIHHVHLKDRKAMHDYASLPVGTGIVPLKDVIDELLRNGYDGWFTVEHFGAPRMLDYATQSVANIQAAWRALSSPSFDEVLKTRRSVRSYDPTKKISEAEVRELIRAAQNAPSWANQQPTRYYVAISPEKVKAVQELVGANKERIENAPVLIVSTFVRGRSGFFRGQQTNEVGDAWGAHDNGLINSYLILKARAMGFDTLIMGMRDADKLRALFQIPENETVMAVIALGYRAEEPQEPRHRDLDEIVHFY